MQLLLRQLKKSTIKFNENPIGIIRKCLYIIIIQDYLDIQSMHPILISNQKLLGFDLSGYPGVTKPKIEKDRQIAMTKRERERKRGWLRVDNAFVYKLLTNTDSDLLELLQILDNPMARPNYSVHLSIIPFNYNNYINTYGSIPQTIFDKKKKLKGS